MLTEQYTKQRVEEPFLLFLNYISSMVRAFGHFLTFPDRLFFVWGDNKISLADDTIT